MLSQTFPDVQPADLQRLLAEIASLLDTLETWTKPAQAAPETSKTATIQNDFAPLQNAGKVKVNIDGASKGNPGPASYGIVFSDLNGGILCEANGCIGLATNNVAEYAALIQALKILVENGTPEAYCFSDSALLVNQVNGKWKIKNPGLQPLVSEAQALRLRLPRFQITHIPREQNKRADELANLALKQNRDASVL
ncbi:ribonuclease HI family protein [bacterium]|nr:ribonuclease HI family protein [bacterium]